jgi:N-acetylglucosamine-6-phosphate deacetylase
MAASIRVLVGEGVALETALLMAARNPAEAVGQATRHGGLLPGMRADIAALTPGLAVTGTWIGGKRIDRGSAPAG